MKIIISPAKKMNDNQDIFSFKEMPQFMDKTEKLLSLIKGLSYDEMKKIWNCSDRLARLNYERIQNMDLYKNLTPAILSYEGIQYQYMAPSVFTESEYRYIEKHLRILSGFYGIVKPFDGIKPYRLEMQARLGSEEADSLYDFWSRDIADSLYDGNDTLLNLASKEYSKAVEPYLNDSRRFITCVFGELAGGKVKEKATMLKMARGEMVRYMAEKQIENIEDIREFDRLGFRFNKEMSDEDNYIFIKQEDN